MIELLSGKGTLPEAGEEDEERCRLAKRMSGRCGGTTPRAVTEAGDGVRS